MSRGSKTEFLQELREAEIIEFQLVSTANNEADMITKKLAGPEHNKHAARLCRHDKYYSTAQDRKSHEQGKVSGVTECSQLEKHKSSRSKNLEIRISVRGIK